MSSRAIKDLTKALQGHFSAERSPLVLPADSRRVLQHFVEEHHGKFDNDESRRANQELRHLFDRYVGGESQKLGAFAGVIRELRPLIVNADDLSGWWHLVGKPVLCGLGYRKAALEDAQEFVVSCMLSADDDEPAERPTATGYSNLHQRLMGDLLEIYVARTRGLTDDDKFVAPENSHVARNMENALVAFGRKQPKDLFHSLDDLILVADTRLQALTLLTSFLRHQTPHIYLVLHTPLVEHLLKCLMNDTSTAVLSAALTSLIMLMPHIPASLSAHLPRLFLIYSRLLCWEKFSPLSTEAQRNLVTDDRVPAGSDSDHDHGDIGIDATWQIARPKDDVIETGTPELLTYFTYLYGMYPLNFASYVRKSRRYLKNVDFPGAEDFDLDQAVIRGRSEQFRSVHLAHPNFFNMTIEEELIDTKWPKADPADVVAACHGLCVHSQASLSSPSPPPTSRLPDLPPKPSSTDFRSRPSSPVSWRDTATAVSMDSPTLKPQRFAEDDVESSISRTNSGKQPGNRSASGDNAHIEPLTLPLPPQPLLSEVLEDPHNNLAYLQRQNTLLRNELNFEKWHKAQYFQHIGQLTRKNVKDATAEAETLNLINANRALKQQLEQLRNARDATIKDSVLTRKQANNMEANMAERLNRLKKEQETWQAEAAELRRLRDETKQYRELLVASEARELNKAHHLELAQRDLQGMTQLEEQLEDARKRLRSYEYRDFEFTRTVRGHEIMANENQELKEKVRRYEDDRERLNRLYRQRISEIKGQADEYGLFQNPATQAGPTPGDAVHQAFAESQTKLALLKRTHARLLEKYTDLELEFHAAKSQLDQLQGYKHSSAAVSPTSKAGPDPFASLGGQIQADDAGLDGFSFDNGLAPMEQNYLVSTSDPTGRRTPAQEAVSLHRPSEEQNVAMIMQPAGLTWQPKKHGTSMHEVHSSKSSLHGPVVANPTAPLRDDERSVRSRTLSNKSVHSDGPTSPKDKIQPQSVTRVYGRGGAQNIKMKDRAKSDGKPSKSGAFRGLKNIL